MRIRTKVTAFACAVGLAFSVGSLNGTASADPAVPFSNDVADYVYGTGSDTTYELMVELGNAFNSSQGCNQIFPNGTNCVAPPQTGVIKSENYDHEVVVNRFPVGSGNGRITLCDQTTPRPGTVPFVNFGRSSSGPSTSGCTDSGLVLRFVAYAKDAIAPVNWRSTAGSPAAGVVSLTQAQLNDIFVDCTITNWNQVGGANGAIEVWSIQPGSGTRSSWDGFVGGNSTNCVPNAAHIIFENNVAPIEALGGFNDAIFPFAVGLHNTDPARAGDSELMDVNGVSPTPANIQNGTFPFSRDVYNVYRQSGPGPVASPATVGFIGENGWICKPQALHSEPPGTPGGGIEDPLATKDYGQLVVNTISAAGFVPKFASGNLCTFSDITVP